MKLTSAFALGIAALMSASPTVGQTPLFDTTAVGSACAASGADCLAIVERVATSLQAQGLAPDLLNSQLGALAAMVIAAVDGAPPAVVAQVGAALRAIADLSTDPAQQVALRELAAQVSAGSLPQQTVVAQALSAN